LEIRTEDFKTARLRDDLGELTVAPGSTRLAPIPAVPRAIREHEAMRWRITLPVFVARH
jgi:hypothetical protein